MDGFKRAKGKGLPGVKLKYVILVSLGKLTFELYLGEILEGSTIL